jgi:glycine/D-amino acid oxidase-like deaminating enzyme
MRLGAQLFEHSAVTGARWDGGLWEVRGERGTVRARTLVLATNAWAPLLCPDLETLIRPRRGQMLSTAPLARTVATRPTYAHWGYQYWRQLEDGRLLIGGWRDLDLDGETGYGAKPTPRIQQAIERGLAELVPEGVAVERRWAGTMAFARDGRPLVGWLDAQHHLAICAGFTGHGMGMAAACTLDLAQMLQFRRAPGIESFDPQRFAEFRQPREGCTVLGGVA